MMTRLPSPNGLRPFTDRELYLLGYKPILTTDKDSTVGHKRETVVGLEELSVGDLRSKVNG